MVWFIVVGVVGLIAGWALNNVNRSFEEFREQEEANRDRKFRESVETIAREVSDMAESRLLVEHEALLESLGYKKVYSSSPGKVHFRYVKKTKEVK